MKFRSDVTVKFLNKKFMPAQNYFVNAATVHDDYDYAPDGQEKKWHRLFEGLIKEGHWNCLDHASPTFYIEAPLFVRDHIVRSSESKFNVASQRYTEFEPVFYIPERLFSEEKRVNLGEYKEVPLTVSEYYTEKMKTSIQVAYDMYTDLISAGIRKEQAARILPTSLYTKFWHTAPLSAWLHFLNLRMDKHAQLETRMVAGNIYDHLKMIYPDIIELWEKYGKGPINAEGTIQTP